APVIGLATLTARAAHAGFRRPRRPAPADLAVLQYTSGSTRSPRGVPVTHGHLAANLTAIREVIRHDELHPGPLLSWLPLYHDLGLVCFLALPMSCGCSLALASPDTFARRPSMWLAAAGRHGAVMTGAPNFAYALATRLLRADPSVRLDSVRRLVSGGEPIDAAVMAAFLAAAVPYGLDPRAVMAGYGLAEATLAVAVAPAGTGLRLDHVDPRELEVNGRAVPTPGGRPLARQGPPLRGFAVRITDRASGADLGERLVGRVEVRGPSVVGHYWGEPPPAPGSWLDTGDLGYLAEGDLVVCGRAKDVVFAAGRNVFPQDVEAAATEVPGVRPGGAVAFGLPGERLVVAVECGGDRAAEVRAAVVDAVVAEVGLTPAAVLVLPPGHLPRTSSGKLRRAEVRHRHLLGTLVPAPRPVPEERQPT
ncbi:MAG TPA: AMP-binding protein, partial [Pseudonocardiaceae bacterium]